MPRRPEELLDPEGRRVVIVVSDYANPPWYQGLCVRILLKSLSWSNGRRNGVYTDTVFRQFHGQMLG